MRGGKGSIVMDYTVSNHIVISVFSVFPFQLFPPLAVFSNQIMVLILCGSLLTSQIAHFLFSP